MKTRILRSLSYTPHYFAIVAPIVAVAIMAHDPHNLTLASFAAMSAVASIVSWRYYKVVRCVDLYFDTLAMKSVEPK